MESIVPIFGHEVFRSNVLLRERIRSIVEDDFGHKIRFSDAGSVAELHRADPMRVVIPFTITVRGALDELLHADLVSPLSLVFPFASHLEELPEYIPAILRNRAEALSLGHVKGGPSEIRRAIRLIYASLANPDFSVPFVCSEIGLCKSTLERSFHHWFNKGVGQIIKHIRMCEARRLTITTTLKVEAISFAVGYENVTSFNRAFISEFGTSATVLRQNVCSVSQKE